MIDLTEDRRLCTVDRKAQRENDWENANHSGLMLFPNNDKKRSRVSINYLDAVRFENRYTLYAATRHKSDDVHRMPREQSIFH